MVSVTVIVQWTLLSPYEYVYITQYWCVLTLGGIVDMTGVVGGVDLPTSDFKLIGLDLVPCKTNDHDVKVPEK